LQPNGRGTLDILQSCLITIILCSWSVLFLNVPSEHDGLWDSLQIKARWMLFSIIFPEVLIGIAIEQWKSACQSIDDFVRLKGQWEADQSSSQSIEERSRASLNLQRWKSAPWTMRHGFFADMGGIILKFPDETPFPVDSQQLVYLVEHNHLEYPAIQSCVIWDRNKADIFARALTLVQILGFFIQSVGRWKQHLALSTFELSSLAFIFCCVNTSYFFWHKPRDVSTALVLPCPATIADIMKQARLPSCEKYIRTPLDFVTPPTCRTSLVAPFWFGVQACFNWKKMHDGTPVKKFGNSTISPPRGLNILDIIYVNTVTIAYFGIHLAGWNFVFPFRVEQVLWRVSCLVLLGMLIFYLCAIALGTVMASWLARTFFKNNEATTILGAASLLPRWAAILLHLPVIIIYCLARSYIIVEGFANLRALPVTAFASVNWANYIPHF